MYLVLVLSMLADRSLQNLLTRFARTGALSPSSTCRRDGSTSSTSTLRSMQIAPLLLARPGVAMLSSKLCAETYFVADLTSVVSSWIQGHPEFGFGFKALFCHDGVSDRVLQTAC